MRKPLISIIMAAFNAEKFIEYSIKSVLEQTWVNWELLIINDGSTDTTKDKIAQLKNKKIIVINQENKGVSSARNIGLLQMLGDYYCFLDADDRLTSESLECRFEIFEKNPDIRFVDGGVDIYDKNLEKLTDQWKPSFKGNPLNELLSISNSCFFGPSWMIRKTKNLTPQFHKNLTHGEDLLFYIELAIEEGIYEFTDKVVLHYRKGHISAMKDLKGLEQGYLNIYKLLLENRKISSEKIIRFKKKARNIIFKSYLGNFQVGNAFLSLLEKW